MAWAPEARSAQLGTFFTEDVDVELGSGAAPIHGRATIIGMAARLQPRTAAFHDQVPGRVRHDGR